MLPLPVTLSGACLVRPVLSGATIPRFRDLFLFSRGLRPKKSVMTICREGCKRRLREALDGERSGLGEGEGVRLGLSTCMMADPSDRRAMSSWLLVDEDPDELSSVRLSELSVVNEASLERGEGVLDKGRAGEASGDKSGSWRGAR
jgi:hypothetical protein